MAYQQTANFVDPATTVNSSYTAGGGSLSVVGVANLPANPNFTIIVITSSVAEFFLVSAITGSGPYTLTVAGAQEGSSAANHNPGDPVYCILSSGALANVLIDTSNVGVDGSAPSATTGARKGMRYRSTDAPYEHIFDGSAWQTFPIGGPVLLEQHTASNSAQLDFTTAISSNYDEYLFELLNLVPASDPAQLHIRMAVGGVFDTGSNYAGVAGYYYTGGTGLSSSSSDSATAISAADTISSNANYGLSAKMRLISPGSTSVYKQVFGQVNWFVGSGVSKIIGDTFAGVYRSTSAVNGVRFFFDSGNITSGIIRCYGIPKGITL